MKKITTTLATTLLATTLLAAVPALAETPVDGPAVMPPAPTFLMRDSDGMVISVLYLYDYAPQPGDGGGIMPGGVYYTIGDTGGAAGGGALPMPRGSDLGGQPILLGGAELLTAGAEGAMLDIGGVSYQVEAKGNQIWLRDMATGERHAAARHIAPISPDKQGLSVNPAQFSLD